MSKIKPWHWLVMCTIILLVSSNLADTQSMSTVKPMPHPEGLSMSYLTDGTRCISTETAITCDWKYPRLLAIIREQSTYIRDLEFQLKQNRRFLTKLEESE